MAFDAQQDGEKNTTFGGATFQQQMIPAAKDFSMIYQITDTKEYLLMMEHLIRREKRDDKGKWSMQPGIQPYMNEEGVQTMMGIISGTIHRTVGQGNFDIKEDKYNTVLAEFMRNVNDTIFLNLEGFNIEEKHIPTLYNLIVLPTRVYLTRLLGDKERSYIFGQKMDAVTQFIKNLVPKKGGAAVY